jgi:hypothetical protein
MAKPPLHDQIVAANEAKRTTTVPLTTTGAEGDEAEKSRGCLEAVKIVDKAVLTKRPILLRI